MFSGSVKNDRYSLAVYLLTAIYIVVAMTAVVKGILPALLLPAGLALVVAAFTSLDKVFLLVSFITPISVNLSETELGIGMSLPAEPIIFGMMLLYLMRLLYQGEYDSKILYHPVTLAIIFHLFWMIITTATSSMFIVSFKHTLARISFVVVFYFLGAQVFRNLKSIRHFSWAYIIMFIVVIGYTLFNHALAGFTEKAAHTSMVPFYNDHTAYAAAAAMFLPLLIGFTADSSSRNWVRWVSFTALLIFIVSLVFSYTRASWVSIIAAFFCYLVFLLKIRTWVVVGGISLVISLYFINQSNITMMLERNEEQSSTDYASHVQSASNITTDASNVERLNRWKSAWRRFLEKPIVGWGPGTYMFQYAPFQKIDEKTIISTNMGEGGNAHSEYIGPLAEQGFIGSIAFIVIGIITIVRASGFIRNCRDKKKRLLAKSLLLGLITYWVHGMLNNFLDTDKASLPFWGFIAALVTMEVYHSGSEDGSKATDG